MPTLPALTTRFFPTMRSNCMWVLTTDHKVHVGGLEDWQQTGFIRPNREDFIVFAWCGMAEEHPSERRNL